MRIAIVSDIHANLQAWNAVLLDIGSSRIDRIVCLGDVVGYGPDPAAVLESVYTHVGDVVLGNHDAAVCGKLNASLFNDAAAEVVRWTRGRLNPKAMQFLRKLPLTLSGSGFRCSHGDFGNPAAFPYVIDPEDAQASWAAVPDPLLFTGHSHTPGIFITGGSGRTYRVDPQDFALEDDKRFLVNAGSVGQPRDGDTRACYCIFDTATQAIYWRRIPFDLDAYRARLEAEGIDPAASYFLRADPRDGLPPVRELLSFSPPADAAEAVQDTIAVAELATLHRAVKRWKRVTACSLCAALLLRGGGGAAAWYRLSHSRVIEPAGGMLPYPAPLAAGDRNLLRFPETSIATPQPIDGWRVHLGDRRAQSIAWTPDADGGHFALQSASDRHRLRLESPPIPVTQGMRLRVELLTRAGADTIGTLGTDVTLYREQDGATLRVENFAGKVPNMRRAEGWMLAQETFTVPAGATAITVAIQGAFTGTFEARDLRLTLVRMD